MPVKSASKKKSVKKKENSNAAELPSYFGRILSSLSPIVTIDRLNRIHYANESFFEAFSSPMGDSLLKKDFFSVIRLKSKAKNEFLKNLQLSENGPIHNCEFSFKNKIFGYSLFPFEDEIGVILRDITDKKKLEKKVESLHSRLLHLQEKERQKLARELHDGVGQTILAAKLNFQSYQKSPELHQERFKMGLSIIDRASQELREIYTDLYPTSLRELGLESTIRWMARHILDVIGCEVDMKFQLKLRIPDEVSVNIFRIVQEIFTNIAKHAKAKKASLELKSTVKGVSLIIADQGKGFDNDKARLVSSGFGLENIRRRVDDFRGTLKLKTEKGKGTVYEIFFPSLKKEDQTE